MKKKSFLPTLVPFLMLLIFVASCQKDDKDDDNTSPNDPNIIEKTLNISITDTLTRLADFNEPPTHYKQVDIDGNGITDFILVNDYAKFQNDTTRRAFYLSANGYDAGFISDSIPSAFGDIYMLRNLSANTSINGLLTGYNGGSFSYIKIFKGANTFADFSEVGTKLVGFKFKSGLNTHYGWLKIGLSFDYKTFTVIEGAYHKNADSEIKAGAK